MIPLVHNGGTPVQSPTHLLGKGFDLIIPGTHQDKVDIHLSGAEYQHISEFDSGRMLGYFTQKLKDQGFPWRIYDCVTKDDNVRRGEQLSEMEALQHLTQGTPVMFQPMRNLQLDLSSNSLSALAAAGKLGGNDMSSMSNMADISKNVAPGSKGVELKFGAPVVVSSTAHLKLLFQMYNPEEKINESNAVSKAAHELSYFTQKTMGSAYPWRFYKNCDGSRLWRMTKALVPGFVGGAAVGAAFGGVIGLPIGLFSGAWAVTKTLISYGAVLGGAYKAIDSARTASKGESINAVEALERVLEDKDVVFQETQMGSIGVPIFGKITWFSDHGKGSSISNTKALDTFYWMVNQAAKPEEPKKEEPPKPQSAPVVIIQDNRDFSRHNDITVMAEHARIRA